MNSNIKFFLKTLLTWTTISLSLGTISIIFKEEIFTIDEWEIRLLQIGIALAILSTMFITLCFIWGKKFNLFLHNL